MADLCDVPGCGQGAKFFAPTRVRCLAHAAADEPALRSDVAVRQLRRDDPDGTKFTLGGWGPDYHFTYRPGGKYGNACHPDGSPCSIGFEEWADLRVVSVPDVARRLRARLAFLEIARAEAARERDETAAMAFGAGETHASAVVAEWVERCTEAARILETFGDIGGAAALRALRGEGT